MDLRPGAPHPLLSLLVMAALSLTGCGGGASGDWAGKALVERLGGEYEVTLASRDDDKPGYEVDVAVGDAAPEILEELAGLEDLHELRLVSADDEALAHFAGSTSLRRLVLASKDGRARITGAGLSDFEPMSELCCLTLDGGGKAPVDLSGLKHFPQLETLFIRGWPVSDEDLQVLQNLRGLESLVVERTAITGTFLPLLSGHPRLQTFVALGNPLEASHLAVLATLPELQQLELSSVRPSQALPDALGRLVGLEHLKLLDMDLIGLDLSSMREMKSLTFLKMERVGTTPGQLAFLAGVETLRHLILREITLDLGTIRGLGDSSVADEDLRALTGAPERRLLDLDGTRVEGPGLRFLEGLATLRSVSVKGMPEGFRIPPELESERPELRFLE